MQTGDRVWFWSKIAIVVLVLLGVFQLFRINDDPPASAPPVVRYSYGSVVDGVVKVSAGGFLSYRINLNRTTYLKGSFDTLSEKLRIECLVLDEANFQKWKSGEEYEAASDTGHLPTAIISPRIGPGVFYLVLSGFKNPDKDIVAETSFALD